MVLDIDEERRRISLGIKQCSRTLGTHLLKCQKRRQDLGIIKSITDFGIFIGLEGNIDGSGSPVRH